MHATNIEYSVFKKKRKNKIKCVQKKKEKLRDEEVRGG